MTEKNSCSGKNDGTTCGWVVDPLVIELVIERIGDGTQNIPNDKAPNDEQQVVDKSNADIYVPWHQRKLLIPTPFQDKLKVEKMKELFWNLWRCQKDSCKHSFNDALK